MKEAMKKGDLTKEEIKQLLKTHGTVVAAAASCGVTRVTFKKWMSAHKIKANPKGRPYVTPMPTKKDLVKELNKGTRKSVAEFYDVSIPGLQKWLDKRGIAKKWA